MYFGQPTMKNHCIMYLDNELHCFKRYGNELSDDGIHSCRYGGLGSSMYLPHVLLLPYIEKIDKRHSSCFNARYHKWQPSDWLDYTLHIVLSQSRQQKDAAKRISVSFLLRLNPLLAFNASPDSHRELAPRLRCTRQ